MIVGGRLRHVLGVVLMSISSGTVYILLLLRLFRVSLRHLFRLLLEVEEVKLAASSSAIRGRPVQSDGAVDLG